jgi:hypothetical protein
MNASSSGRLSTGLSRPASASRSSSITSVMPSQIALLSLRRSRTIPKRKIDAGMMNSRPASTGQG